MWDCNRRNWFINVNVTLIVLQFADANKTISERLLRLKVVRDVNQIKWWRSSKVQKCITTMCSNKHFCIHCCWFVGNRRGKSSNNVKRDCAAIRVYWDRGRNKMRPWLYRLICVLAHHHYRSTRVNQHINWGTVDCDLDSRFLSCGGVNVKHIIICFSWRIVALIFLRFRLLFLTALACSALGRSGDSFDRRSAQTVLLKVVESPTRMTLDSSCWAWPMDMVRKLPTTISACLQSLLGLGYLGCEIADFA